MARMNAALHALNRGEVSKIALTRIDAEKLRLAAQCQLNWLPFTIGPMMLRPGLEMIGETRSDNRCTLIDFIFAPDDTALLELTTTILRVWINDALVTREHVHTAVSDPDFAGGGTWSTADTTAGCSATITGGLLTLTCRARGGLARASQAIAVPSNSVNIEHGLRIVVANGPVTVQAGSTMGLSDYLSRTVLDTGTHSLTVTPTGSTINLQIDSTDARAKTLSHVGIEDAGILTLPTPWGINDLASMRWTQSADIIYIAAYGKQQYKIERRGARPGARGWSVVAYRSDNGPMQSVPTANANLTPSVMEGNGTLTADAAVFEAGHVGALFQLFTDGQTNQTLLGGSDSYTEPVRVAGVNNDRIFGWNVSGSWVGQLTLQRSVVGRDTGFVDVAFTIINGLISQDDSNTYNNVICWYRVGFKHGDYVSGSATVYFGQNVATGGSSVSISIGDVSATPLGADTWSDPLAITGSGDTRTFVASIDDTIGLAWHGKATLQQSLTGLVADFTDMAQIDLDASGGYRLQVNDGIPSGTTYYRIGVKQLDYTDGIFTLRLTQPGFGGTGGSSANGAAALAGGRVGICRVTGYTSPTSVSIEVLTPFSSLNPTKDWQQSDWSGAVGWPTAPAFHEGRLWWLGSKIWGSQASNFTGYAEINADGESLGDASAIIESFGEGPIDRINWGMPLTRLLCGRERSITSIRSSSFDEPLTPTNFSAKDCSEQGASRLAAKKVGKRGMFVQQSGRRVYEAFYDANQMDYNTHDLTRFNIDIGKSGFVDIDICVQPDKVLYLPRNEGQVAALLYDPDDQVEAWWRLQTLGIVENVRVLPSETGIEDNVYFVVKRTINGVNRRFIEKQAARDECKGGSVNKLLDSFVAYSGAATTSIVLPHLPNTLVAVWADGLYIGTGTTGSSGELTPLPDGQAHSDIVAGLTGSVETWTSDTAASTMAVPSRYNGYPCEVFANQFPSDRPVHVGTLVASGATITLPDGWLATTIVACFGYVAPFMSSKLAYGAQMGTALAQKKQADHVGLMMFDTGAQAITAGQRMDQLDSLPLVEDEANVDPATIWGEYDEPMIEIPGEWDTDARLCLLAQAPNPAMVGGVVVSVTTQN